MTLLRRILVFRGRVQGVGFRWTTSRMMQDLPLAGFVRNMNDGTVQIVIEGEPDEIENGVELLNEKMGGLIEGVNFKDSPGTGEFSGFSIQ